MGLEKSVVVPLGTNEAFSLLTEPDLLRRWQVITARVDLRAGGGYRWTIVPGHSATGVFTEVEPGRRLGFTWGWEGSKDVGPGASTVTVTLEPMAGGTRVHLAHAGLNETDTRSHGEGWEHYLARLMTAAREGDGGADDWAAVPEPLDELGAAEAALASCQIVLRGLGPDDGALPSPCREFTIDALVAHLIGSVTALGSAAGAEIAVAESGTAESRVAAVSQQALEGWRRRGTEGTVTLARTVPASLPVSILALEFLIHAWDVGRATDQVPPVSSELSSYVLELAGRLITPEMRNGTAFAAEVPTDPGADALTRLAAFTGRAV